MPISFFVVTMSRAPYNRGMDEELLRTAALLLANGYSTTQATKRMREDLKVSNVQALNAVKEVYRIWEANNNSLGNDLEDARLYHIELRHELLRRTLDACNSTADIRAALAILDSMAPLQGLKDLGSVHVEANELSIQLVPKQEKEEESEDGE